MEPWISVFSVHINVRQPFNKNGWMNKWATKCDPICQLCQYVALGIIAIMSFALCCHDRYIFQRKWNEKRVNYWTEWNRKTEGSVQHWHYCAVKRISCDILPGVGWKPEKPHFVLCFVFCIEHYMRLLCQKRTGIKINQTPKFWSIFNSQQDTCII